MPYLRCTQKLLHAIGSPRILPRGETQPTLLGDWYANLLRVGRQQALLFTNEATLYAVAVLGVRRAACADLPQCFRDHLQQTLAEERLLPGLLDALLVEYRDVTLARTASRSVLGSMNDVARHVAYHVCDAGGPAQCDRAALHRQLNDMPHQPLGWQTAAEALRARLLRAESWPSPRQTRVFLN